MEKQTAVNQDVRARSCPSISPVPFHLKLRILASLIALAALAGAAGAQALRPPVGPGLIRDLFNSGIRAQVDTLRGETIWLDGLNLTTPADFDTLPAGQPFFRFSADTPLPGGDFFLDSIQRIAIGELSTTFMGSNPKEMEYYRLGDLRTAVPPPPDWKHAIGPIPPWHRGVALTNLEGLPFLGHALYCWNARANDKEKDLGVYLFRQNFHLDNTGTIARATLRLGVNIDVIEAAFNETPVHFGGVQKPSLAEFEVTPLIHEGDNIFALKVRGRAEDPGTNYGLAFHLEIERRKVAETSAPALDPAAALMTSRAGDRLWGTIQDLRDDRILMKTRFGLYSLPWGSCAGVLFPAGWQLPAAPSLRERLYLGSSTPDRSSLNFNTLPLWMVPGMMHDCLLLTEGRVTTAKPATIMNGKLFFEEVQGGEGSVAMGDVLGIFPPVNSKNPFKRPPDRVATLYCQADTRTGEVVGGLLRQISPETVVIESEGGQMLTIKTETLAGIRFPYHGALLSRAEAQRGPVALLPPTDKEPPARAAYEAASSAVQEACFTIGAEVQALPVENAANAGRLTPQRYPILVSVDPAGRYLDSYFGDGDARNALANYVKTGGVLLAISRGGALRSAVTNQDGALTSPEPADGTAPNSSLLDLFNIQIARPGETAGNGIVPFKQVGNGADFNFARAANVSEELEALPRRIELAPMPNIEFYPMIAQGGRQTILYNLTDARHKIYGPALSVIAYGRGRIVIIDHTLWDSRLNGRPFAQSILPILLHWAMK